jgi:hypothetical protein
MPEETLHISFHGRVIDHLGIQMYQSPVAALAEMVSNAWDADAEHVWITLPGALGDTAEIEVRDDGIGMTRQECENKYLKVGWCRRGDVPDEKSGLKQRPILGRKGIGKFAGFGICQVMHICTISAATGESTEFDLDVERLRGEDFIETEGGDIAASCEVPSEARKLNHGTSITLRRLSLGRAISEAQFSRGMSRRFLLLKRAADFKVLVNNTEVTEADNDPGVEFIFPRDYPENKMPNGLVKAEDGWVEERLSNGRTIRWRFSFYKDPIDVEELRGVAVYANGKLAQAPFLFNLTGGLGGQHGLEYLSGQVEAEYLDQQSKDLIATERQRVNWDSAEAQPLEAWGQARLKEMLRIWQELRGVGRQREMEQKLAGFSARLGRLPGHEAKVVRRALAKLGQVAALSKRQFDELGQAILSAWEQGRLHDLVSEISDAHDMAEGQLIEILVEADVLTSLSAGESVKTKLLTVAELKTRVDARDLELSVRDYLAAHPWIVDPRWDAFRKEITLGNLVAAIHAELHMDEGDWRGRVDLALASGEMLILLELMRPGLRINREHVDRFEEYMDKVGTSILTQTGGRFKTLTGYIVADKIGEDSALATKIRRLEQNRMYAMTWGELLGRAVAQWREQLEILVARAPADDRLRALLPETTAEPSSAQP